MTRSNHIEGKYDPDTGAGIEFELHGKKCITLSRTLEKEQLTGRFTNVEDCIEAVEAVFDKIFGPPWVLYQGCTTTTWEEYKAELLADYGR